MTLGGIAAKVVADALVVVVTVVVDAVGSVVGVAIVLAVGAVVAAPASLSAVRAHERDHKALIFTACGVVVAPDCWAPRDMWR